MLDLPKGSKKCICIPKAIFKDKNFIKRCVVGIIDTDFTISPNLCLHGSLTCLNVVNQLQEIFDSMDIKYSLNMRNNVGYFRIRKESSIKIIRDWGLHNPKHLSRYFLNVKYRKSLAFTSTNERLEVLNGKMNFDELEIISEERRRKIRRPGSEISP